jgi:hypothetical protein
VTRRAGGWILALLIVGAMGGGGWFALRGALRRETVAVWHVESPRGAASTSRAMVRGAEFALKEANGRAGRFRVEFYSQGGVESTPVAGWFGTSEALLSRGHQQGRPFHVSVFDTFPLEPVDCYRISAGFGRQGSSAARWAKSTGATRVFLIRDPSSLRSKAIATSFENAAPGLGLAMAGTADEGVDTVNRILISNADLVFFSGEEAPYVTATKLFTAIRQKGFTGRLVTGEADPEISFLATRSGPVDGTYLVSPFAPAPRELADRMGFVPGPHVTAGYYAMKALLDTIDRANSIEEEDLHRSAARLPPFSRPCALFVARNGVFEFVETLP